MIDGARITVTYGRPSMRGRTIFGALVPFDRVWCPGADEATVLDSDKPIQLDTLKVPAGPHTIWVLPTANQWTLIVSKEPSGFHTQYHPKADLGRVTLRKSAIKPPVEQLTCEIAPNRPADPTIANVAGMWTGTLESSAFASRPISATLTQTGVDCVDGAWRTVASELTGAISGFAQPNSTFSVSPQRC